jgi:hypothetical protein
MTPEDRTTAPSQQDPATSEETIPDHVLRASDTRAIPIVGPPLVAATSPSSDERPRPDLFDTIVLPVVPERPLLAPTARRELQRPAQGARNGRDNKRASAPAALRFSVVSLFLLLVAASVTLVALRVDPTTFDSLRATYVVPDQSQPRAAQVIVSPAATHAALVSTTSSAITYSVPTSSYSIVVKISHPCWLVVRSPATSSKTVLAKTIEPTHSPLSVPVHGSASITIAARAVSLSIVSGATVLDTVENPRLGVAYTFVATSPQ